MLQSDWAALYVAVCTSGIYQCLQATSSESEVGGTQAIHWSGKVGGTTLVWLALDYLICSHDNNERLVSTVMKID